MLQPLPDVFSWSWGGLTADPTTGAQPREGEAVLAKFAAMGVQVCRWESGGSEAPGAARGQLLPGACSDPAGG